MGLQTLGALLVRPLVIQGHSLGCGKRARMEVVEDQHTRVLNGKADITLWALPHGKEPSCHIESRLRSHQLWTLHPPLQPSLASSFLLIDITTVSTYQESSWVLKK